MDISTLTNEEVWRRFLALAADERAVIADLVASLAEVERRELVKESKWPNLFEYCVCSLRWSESAAYRRIRAARAVRRFPVILEMLRDGRLHLDGVVILHAFIDDADFASLLLRSVGLTTKGIERLVADRRRDFPLRDSMRFVGVAPSSAAPPGPAPDLELLPSGGEAGRPGSISEVPPPGETASPPAPVAGSPVPHQPGSPIPSPRAPDPPAPRLVRIGFTADESLHRMVLHAQRLMRHKYPDGRLEGVFRDALRLLIEKKDLGVRAALAAGRRARRARRAEEKTGPPAISPPLKPTGTGAKLRL